MTATLSLRLKMHVNIIAWQAQLDRDARENLVDRARGNIRMGRRRRALHIGESHVRLLQISVGEVAPPGGQHYAQSDAQLERVAASRRLDLLELLKDTVKGAGGSPYSPPSCNACAARRSATNCERSAPRPPRRRARRAGRRHESQDDGGHGEPQSSAPAPRHFFVLKSFFLLSLSLFSLLVSSRLSPNFYIYRYGPEWYRVLYRIYRIINL